MSELLEDEVGGVAGPQAAARAALEGEVVGSEGDGGPGDGQALPPTGPDQETWEELLLTGIGSVFSILGSRWPKMAATEKEVEMLAKSWAPVCEKHAGPVIPIEYVAVGATLLIVGPKVIGAIGDHKAEVRARQAAASEKRARDPGTAYPNAPSS